MGFDTSLTDLMPDTVTVKTLAGLSADGYGTPTWSTGTTLTARVSGKQQRVRTFEGTEELATTVVWVKTTSTYGPSSQWTLPGSVTPTLLNVEHYDDTGGLHHMKLFFG